MDAQQTCTCVCALHPPTACACLPACVGAQLQDTFPLHVAAHKALTAQARGRLATTSLHTELVFNMSGSKHIAESLRRFGITDETSLLLVGKFDATDTQLADILQLVQGVQVPLSQLASFANQALLQKYYKLAAEEMKVGNVTDCIVGRIAARDC
ncbi:MAG: hypothetical protein WDW38_011017 [Sanguina aurantia]